MRPGSLLVLGALAATQPAVAQLRAPLASRSLELDLADVRLVRNVEPLRDATTQLLRLRPVRYQVQSPVDAALLGPQRMGFIAQQLFPVFPNMVKRDYDAAGTLHVDYTQLIPILTRAMQEQDAKLRRLEGELNAMNQELVQLRAENGRLTVGLAAASVGGSSGADVERLQAQMTQLQAAVGQLQGLARQLTGTP